MQKIYQMIAIGRPKKLFGFIDDGYQAVGLFEPTSDGDNVFHLISKMGKGVFSQLGNLFAGGKLAEIMLREKPRLAKEEYSKFVSCALIAQNNEGKAPWHYMVDNKDDVSFSTFCGHLGLFDSAMSKEFGLSVESEMARYITRNPRSLPYDFIEHLIKSSDVAFFEGFYNTGMLTAFNPQLFKQTTKLCAVGASVKLSDQEAGLLFRASFDYNPNQDGDLIRKKTIEQTKKLIDSSGLRAVIDANNLNEFIDFAAKWLEHNQRTQIIDIVLGEAAAAQMKQLPIDNQTAITAQEANEKNLDEKKEDTEDLKQQQDDNFEKYREYLVKKINKNCVETVYKQIGPDATDVHKIILIACRNKDYLDRMLAKASRKNQWPETTIDDFTSKLISRLDKQDFYHTSKGKISGNIYTIACAHRDIKITPQIIHQGQKIGVYGECDNYLFDIAIQSKANQIVAQIINSSNSENIDWYHVLSCAVKYANDFTINLYASSDAPKVLSGNYKSCGNVMSGGKYTILNRIIASVVELASAVDYLDDKKLDKTSKKILVLINCFETLSSNDKLHFGAKDSNSNQILRKAFSLIAKLKFCVESWSNVDAIISDKLSYFRNSLLNKYKSLLANLPECEEQNGKFLDAAYNGEIDMFSMGTKISHFSALSDIDKNTLGSNTVENLSSHGDEFVEPLGDLQ